MASSQSSRRGCRMRARAMAMRCFSPPLTFCPRSPTCSHGQTMLRSRQVGLNISTGFGSRRTIMVKSNEQKEVLALLIMSPQMQYQNAEFQSVSYSPRADSSPGLHSHAPVGLRRHRGRPSRRLSAPSPPLRRRCKHRAKSYCTRLSGQHMNTCATLWHSSWCTLSCTCTCTSP